MKCIVFVVSLLLGFRFIGGMQQVLYQYDGCYQYSNFSTVRGCAHTLYQGHLAKCTSTCQAVGNSSLYVGIQQQSDRVVCYCDQNLPAKLKEADDSVCASCLLRAGTNVSCGALAAISVYKTMKFSTEVDPLFDLNNVDLLAVRDGHAELWSAGSLVSPVDCRVRHPVRAVDLHFRRREGFALLGNMICRFNLSIPANTLGLVHTGSRHITTVTAFAVDWEHDHLLWVEHSPPAIKMADLDGANRMQLIALDPKTFSDIHDIAVDPYKGWLFIVTLTSLWSCELDGQGLHLLVHDFQTSLPAVDSRLALDLAAEMVYFSTNSATPLTTARILRIGYNTSGQYTTFRSFTHRGQQVVGLAVLQSDVYFLLQDKRPGGLKRASNDNAINKELVKDERLTMARVINASLQTPARRDPCTAHGCSHHCVVAGTTARCRCPAHYQVAADNKTCEATPGLLVDDWSPLLYVVVGSATLLGAVLSVGVLLCLAHKLWSSLHSLETSPANPQEEDREMICIPLELRNIEEDSR